MTLVSLRYIVADAGLALGRVHAPEEIMPITEPLVSELERECTSTRRILERVPEAHLAWRPHERSMTLGQLALHVAKIPGTVAQFVEREEMEKPDFRDLPQGGSLEEILDTHQESVGRAVSVLRSMDDDTARTTWRMVEAGETLVELPRAGVVRVIMLNHLYHHRGELCLYLRLLDVPVPSVYGPSADESPFE